jgi:hypothetical protein
MLSMQLRIFIPGISYEDHNPLKRGFHVECLRMPTIVSLVVNTRQQVGRLNEATAVLLVASRSISLLNRDLQNRYSYVLCAGIMAQCQLAA